MAVKRAADSNCQLACWQLPCSLLLCCCYCWHTSLARGLQCTDSTVPVAGASSAQLLLFSNCSYCVTLVDNLRQHADPQRVRRFCSQHLSPVELAMSLDQFDTSQLSRIDAVQPQQLELFSARRLTKICLAGCLADKSATALSHAACRYDSVLTTNIADTSGEVLDTAVISNVTYYCCRHTDHCNSHEIVQAGFTGAPAAKSGTVNCGYLLSGKLALLTILMLSAVLFILVF